MIHIINKFENSMGGTELHTIDFYKVLCRHTDVKLWCEFEPHPWFSNNYAINLIRPKRLQYPKTGTFVFIGSCFYVGRWLDLTAPSRIIVHHNYDHDSHKDWFRRARSPWHPEIEWTFSSKQIMQRSGLKGPVEPSPIDLERFYPSRNKKNNVFTVGRLSRDVIEKFHEDDPALFILLAELGIRIRIMGGTILNDLLPEHPLIEILPEGAEDSSSFLSSLDCFIYRTRSSCFEAFGRVVAEAMASGLPVICGNLGGYTEFIEHNSNGFLFDENIQAVLITMKLRDNQKMGIEVGDAARRSIVDLYQDGLPRKTIDYYLRDAS
jgi:glycosyltransferase involved in cell wall biosynthesis